MISPTADSTYYSDSTILKIEKSGETVIIVGDQRGQNDDSTNWMTSLLIPIIIVVVGTIISFFINRNKTKTEIKKLDLDSAKVTEEIENIKKERLKISGEAVKLNFEVEKMRSETEMVRNSFQPYVLNTLNETQKEILKLKLEGLKQLNNLSKSYYHFDNPYDDGQPVIDDEHDYYSQIFRNFGKFGYQQFQNFIADYEYIYPKLVRTELEGIKSLMHRLYELNKRKDSLPYFDLSDKEIKELKQLSRYFDIAIDAIRKDLQLDSTFINDFLQQYGTKS